MFVLPEKIKGVIDLGGKESSIEAEMISLSSTGFFYEKGNEEEEEGEKKKKKNENENGY